MEKEKRIPSEIGEAVETTSNISFPSVQEKPVRENIDEQEDEEERHNRRFRERFKRERDDDSIPREAKSTPGTDFGRDIEHPHSPFRKREKATDSFGRFPRDYDENNRDRNSRDFHTFGSDKREDRDRGRERDRPKFYSGMTRRREEDSAYSKETFQFNEEGEHSWGRSHESPPYKRRRDIRDEVPRDRYRASEYGGNYRGRRDGNGGNFSRSYHSSYDARSSSGSFSRESNEFSSEPINREGNSAMVGDPMSVFPSRRSKGSETTEKNYIETEKEEGFQGSSQNRFASLFFWEHRNDRWLIEKYEPRYLERKHLKRLELVQVLARQFSEKLNDSNHDFRLNLPEEHNLPHSNSNDSNNSSNRTSSPSSTGPLEGQQEIATGTERADNDSNKGVEEGELSSLAAIEKAEKKMENSNETSENMQVDEERKEDDGEMNSHISREDSSHSLTDSSSSALSSSITEKRNETVLSHPFFKQQQHSAMTGNVIFVKAVASHIGRDDLLSVFEPLEGFIRLTISEPLRQKNFLRYAWATFASKEQASKALGELSGKKIHDFELQMSINKPSASQRIHVAPPIASEDSRISKDLKSAAELCRQLDKEKQLEGFSLLKAIGEDGSIEDGKMSRVDILDRLIAYLRFVHWFCYYCGEEYEDEDELLRKCGQTHWRGRKTTNTDLGMDANNDQWAQSLDQKIQLRINHPPDLNVLFGKNRVQRKLEELFEQHIIKIEEEKFRCGYCSKLFCGDNFVRKHINGKHMTEIEQAKNKALEKQYFENYLADPRRPVPAFSPSPSGLSSGPNVPANRRFPWTPTVAPSPFFRSPSTLNTRTTFSPGTRRLTPDRSRPLLLSSPFSPMVPLMVPMLQVPLAGDKGDPRVLREYQDLDAPAATAGSFEINYEAFPTGVSMGDNPSSKSDTQSLPASEKPSETESKESTMLSD